MKMIELALLIGNFPNYIHMMDFLKEKQSWEYPLIPIQVRIQG